MERFVTGFLRASLAWFVLGTTLGAVMVIHPAWIAYRPVHLHLLLLGFVVMMIAGVAYHVIPRFTAAPLHAPRVALAHLYVANIGLVLLTSGFATRVHGLAVAPWLLGSGGTLSALGAWMLAWNLWRTLDQTAIPPTQLPRARPLRVAPPSGRADV